MNIYLLSQKDNNDYDTYDACIVYAESEDNAKLIHPNGEFYDFNKYNKRWDNDRWSRHPDKVKVEYVGQNDDPNIKEGVILYSFCAG